MSIMDAQFFDSIMVEEQAELDEEKEEVALANEDPSIGHAVNMYHCIFTAQKSIVDKKPSSDGPNQKERNRYNLRNQGLTTVRKSKKAVSTKIISNTSKDKTIPLETTNQVPSSDTSVNILVMDYNIVDDMKKVRANISMFEITKITIQQDILLWELGKNSSGNATSSNKGSSKSFDSLTYVFNAIMMDENTLYLPFMLTF